MEYEPNPDVAPYQPANFMSSTILKKVPIPKRHLDTFGGYEYNFMGKRGVMLHTDRYQVDFIKSFDGMTQRDRLQAGMNYVEAMRGTKRRRELVPHRAQLDLIMGGKQIEFEERFYISRELQKLKALAMPDLAKDLYHGRGIHLPGNHHSIKPRYPMPNDFEIEAMASAPSSLQSLLRKADHHTDNPRFERDPTFLGRGSQLRTRSTLNRHPHLPSIRGHVTQGFDVIPTTRGQLPRGRLNHSVTSLSQSHNQAPPPSRDPIQDPARSITKAKSGPATQGNGAAPEDTPTNAIGDHETSVQDRVPATTMHAPSAPETTSTVPVAEDAVSATPTTYQDGGPTPGGVSGQPADGILRPDTEEGMSNRTTPNLLRGADLIHSVPQDEQEELRQTFQRLDTDMDGHIRYNQLKTQLPKAFSPQQERFIEEVYNLTNSITFFGLDEFMAMDRLSKTVEALGGRAKEAYESLDFPSLPEQLLKYVSKFDAADSGNRSYVDIEALQRILSEMVSPVMTSEQTVWDEILDSISVDYGAKINKISFIAHIPLFLVLEKDYR